MEDAFSLNCLLVPVGFSAASRVAFQRAVHIASGENPVIIVLHVIDASLVEFASGHVWGSKREVAEMIRRQAEETFKGYRQPPSGTGPSD